MLTPYEKKQLLTLNQTLREEFRIGVIKTDHEKSRSITQFCSTLSQLVPKIRIQQEKGDSHALPAIRIHPGLMYQAVPSGTEVGPFIEALHLIDSGGSRMNKLLINQVQKINLPTNLFLYVSPVCKFCPKAVRQLLPLPILNRHIRLTIIDGIHFPELAEKDRIKSVPTLILENRSRWTGFFQINEIVDVMVNRDPGALGPAALETMLKEGQANRLAEMMLEKSEIFPAFYEVLVHPKWPVRLGAMVVMEDLIEKNLDLALQSLQPLWERFNTVDNRVKGDLLYVFGEMQQEAIVPWLETVIKGEYEAEVQEAAREALDKLSRKK